MNLNLFQRTANVPANGQARVDLAGTFLLFSSANGSFNFSIDGGPMCAGLVGMGIDTTADPTNRGRLFSNVIIQDTSGIAQSVSFYVSTAAISFINLLATNVSKDANTFPACTNLTLGAGAYSSAFSGTNSSGKMRKHFLLSNLDGTNSLTITASASQTYGIACPAGQSRIVATSGGLFVYTPGSSSVSASVMEIFYS